MSLPHMRFLHAKTGRVFAVLCNHEPALKAGECGSPHLTTQATQLAAAPFEDGPKGRIFQCLTGGTTLKEMTEAHNERLLDPSGLS